MGGFTYNVEVTSCVGCLTQSTVKGVTYYRADDVPPSAPFAAELGALVFEAPGADCATVCAKLTAGTITRAQADAAGCPCGTHANG